MQHRDHAALSFSPATTTTVSVIDTALEDWASLASAWGSAAEVILLAPGEDGLDALTRALAGHTAIDALHVFSHGAEGAVLLGSCRLDTEALDARRDDIAALAARLAEGATILLYGCEIAAGQGPAFLRTLADMTGATVGASTTPTGAAALGGDWDLDWVHGASPAAVQARAVRVEGFAGLMATPPSLGLTVENPYFQSGLNLSGSNGFDLFNGVRALTNDAGETFSGMVLKVFNVRSNVTEFLNIGGTDVRLANGSGSFGQGNYTVSVVNGVATVSLSGMSLSDLAMDTLIDGIRYKNTSLSPTLLNPAPSLQTVLSDTRPVVIQSITDSGATNNVTTVNAVATVNQGLQLLSNPNITATPNSPTLTVTPGTAQQVSFTIKVNEPLLLTLGTSLFFNINTPTSGLTVSNLKLDGKAPSLLGSIPAGSHTLTFDLAASASAPAGVVPLSIYAGYTGLLPNLVGLSSGSLMLNVNNGPVLQGATIYGNALVLTYDQALDAVNGPAAGNFAVTIGGSVVAVNSVAIDSAARTVTLTLAQPAAVGAAVTVAYTDPTAGNDVNAIQGPNGVDAASFLATPVVNNTPLVLAPLGLTLTAGSNSGSLLDLTTNVTTPTITGTAQPLATVSIYDGNTLVGTATANALGVWSATLKVLPDGVHNLTAKATIGAQTSADSIALAITIDTTPPPVPVITSGLQTNVLLPVLTGTAEAGALLSIQIGGATYNTVAVGGAWSLNLATAVPILGNLVLNANGSNTVRVSATDVAGNVSSAGTVNLIIDNTPPPAPVFTSGALTNVAAPILTGTAEVGATVTVTIGGATYSTVATGGNWTINLATAVPVTGTLALNINGNNPATATARDAAGNVSPNGTQNLVIDTVAPTAPVINSAGLTNVGAPILTGTAESGSTVTVTVGGATYTLTATNGAWSLNLATATPASGTLALNANGTNGVSVTARDAAGNVSAAGTQSLVIDTTPPNAPTVTSAALTNATAPIITGTAETGSTVTVTVGGATYNVIAANGTWSLNLATATPASGTLALNVNGNNAISATVRDAAGNTSTAGSQTLVIDTTAPVAPTVTSGALTNVGAPLLTGTAETGTTVTVSVGGATYNVVAVNGAWSVNLATATPASGTLALNTNGSNAINVTARDAAGNVSTAGSQSLVIDTTPPAAPLVTSAGLTNVAAPTVSGTAEAGTTVTVSVGGATYSVVAVNGAWSVNLATATPTSGALALNANGTNPISVTARDAAGNVSGVGNQTLTIDTTPPPAPAVTSAALTNVAVPVVSGTAENGTTVTVTVTVAGATYTAAVANGTWSVNLATATPTSGTLALNANGNNAVSVTAADAAGNVSAPGAQTLVIDTTPPAAPVITSTALTNVAAPILTGTAENGTTVTVIVAGATYTVGVANGAWSVNLATAQPASGTLALNANGTNPVSVTARDAAGNTSASGDQSLVIDTTPPAAPSVGSAELTNLIAPVLSGTADAGTSVTVSVGGASYVVIATGGIWSVDLATARPATGTLSLNTNGTNEVSVTARDAAGNVSSAATQTLSIDTTPPPAPVITSEALTNAASPILTGTGENGTTITVTVAGATYTTTVANGTWSVNLGAPDTGTSALNLNGTNAVSVTARDAAGNVSGSGTQALVIDTTPPNPPAITSPIVTNIVAPVLSGTADTGTTVTVAVGTATYTVVAVNGTWVLDLATAEPATGELDLNTSGANPVSVTATDAAGNVSTATQLTLTIDTSVPTPAAITSAALTNVAEPTLTGTADPAETVIVQIGTAIYTVIPAANGIWSLDLSAAQPDEGQLALDENGPNQVLVTTRTSGGTGTTVNQTLVIDTTPPANPVVTSGALTNLVAPVITGTAEPAATVIVEVAGATYRVVATDGTWTLPLGSATPVSGTLTLNVNGENTVVARALDAAGNLSGDVTSTLGIDTTPPATPVIDVQAVTNNPAPTLTGTAEPNVLVIVSVGGATYEVTAGAGGAWQIDLATADPASGTLNLDTNGNNVVSATARDAAGNVSGTGTQGVVIDTIAPDLPVITSAGPFTVAAPVITGTAEAGSTVNVTIGGATFTTMATDGTWRIDLAQDTPSEGTLALDTNGANPVSVTATDAAGNISDPAEQALVIDTEGPAAPTDVVLPVGVTNAADVTVAASTLEPGATWQYSLDGGATWLNGEDGIFTVPDGTYAANQIQVRQVDALGNAGTPLANPAQVTVDTVAPVAPTLNGQAPTNDVTPVLSGTAEPGSVVTVIVGGAEYDVTAVDGVWSVDLATAPTRGSLSLDVNGDNPVTVTTTDAAGNTSPSSSQTLVIDTLPPTAPAITSAALSNDALPLFTGTAEVGSTVILVVGNATFEVLAADGTWTVDLASATPISGSLTLNENGDNPVSVTARDAAGNVSSPTEQTLILDTSAPATPLVTSALLTNLAAPVISGTAEADTSVTVAIGNAVFTVVAIDGVWRLDLATATPTEGTLALDTNGGNAFSVTATDAAGNVSAPGAQTLVIDTVAPEAPAGVVLPAGDTNADTVTVDLGQLEDGATWQYSLDGGLNWLDGQGTGFTLPQATYAAGQIQVRQVDAAGNLGTPLATTAAVTIDTTPPAIPTITSAALTNAALPVINGTAEPGSTVVVTIGGATYEVPAGTGTWSLDLAQATPTAGALALDPNGENPVTATARDAAGNLSPAATQPLVIDTTGPDAPIIDSADLTNIPAPTVSGTAATGTLVTVSVAGATYVVTATDGTWSVNLATATPATGTLSLNANGENTVSVTAKDAAGNVSTAQTQTLVIDTTAPLAPTLTSPLEINSLTPTLTGTAESGSTVVVTVGGATYSVTAQDGAWTLDLTTATPTLGELALIPNGENPVTLTAIDAAGNASAASGQTLIVDTTPPADPTITSLLVTNALVPVISGTADADSTVTVTVGGATYTVIPAGGVWSLNLATATPVAGTLALNVNGENPITVVSTDAAGNASGQIDQTLTIDSTPPAAPTGVGLPTGGATNVVLVTVDPAGLEPNATWQYSLDGGQNWLNGVGNSFELPQATYVAGQIQVRQIDAAGNPGAPVVTGASVVVDTTPPAAPAFTSVALTNAPTPLLAGTAEAGSTVTVVVGGATYTVVATTGLWTLDLATATPIEGTLGLNANGENPVSMTARDAAGNLSSSTTQTLVIDTTPPAAPTVTSPAQTNVTAPVLSGTAEPGSTVTVTIGGATYIVPASSGAWSVDLANTPPSSGTLSLVTNGTNPVSVTATDAAGNTSTAGEQDLAISPFAPTPLAITSAPLTNAENAVLSGTAQTGDTVTVEVGGATYVVVAQNGAWQVTLGTTVPSAGELQLVNGANPITVTSTSPSGTATGSATQDFVLDTTPPVAPEVTSPDQTNVAAPVITGRAEPGCTIKLSVGGATYDILPVNGLWSLNLATAQPTSGTLTLDTNGINVVTVIAIDPAGNESAPLTIDLAIDTAARVPLEITSGDLTNALPPVITGTAETGDTIAITVSVGGATYIVTAVNGVWTLDLANAEPVSGTLTLNPNGDNTVSVTATDSAGGISGQQTQTLVIDTTPPSSPVITSPTETYLTLPVLTGTVIAEDEAVSLTVVVGGATYLVTPANGTWSLDLATATPIAGILALNTTPAGNTVTVTARDAAGNVSLEATQQLVIDTSLPTPLSITSADLTNVAAPVLEGTAETGDVLTITVGGATYTVTAVNDAWRLDLATAVPASGTLALVVNGDNPVSISAVNSGGQPVGTSSQTLTIDTTPPAAPVGVGLPTGGATNNPGVTLDLLELEPNATWQYSLDGGQTWRDGAGESFSLLDGSYGVGQIQVRQVDAAGNAGAPVSNTAPVTIDTVPPVAPAVTSAAQGNVATPIISGTAEAGTTVIITVGGATYEVPVTNGTWRLDLATAEPVDGELVLDTEGGANAVNVIARDAAGNESTAASQTLIIDTAAPTPVAITSDDLTNTAEPVVSGTAPTGHTVEVTVGGATYTVVAANGTWSVDLVNASPTSGSLALNANGANAISVTATAPGGTPSGSDSQSLVIDTTPPLAPAITSPVQTNTANPVLSGTAEAGSTVTVTVAGATYVVSAADGTWSVTLGTTIPTQGTLALNLDGNNPVSVIARDAAGNVSPAGSQSLVIDTVAPPAPVISSVSATNDATPILTGTAQAGSTVVVTVGGATYTLTAPAGTWSVDLATAVPTSGTLSLNLNGTNTVSARATDAAGNTSDAGTQNLLIDTVAPNAPVITSPALTNDDTPVITGTAEAGSTVSISVGGAIYSVAAPAGTWTLDLATATPASGTLNLVAGSNPIVVTATDAVGNTSINGGQTLVIDGAVPTPFAITSTALTNAEEPVISGTAPDGATVTVIVGGATYTVVATDGTWVLDLATVEPTAGELSLDLNGSNPVQATATDALGSPIGTGLTQTLVIDTTAPVAPTITSPAQTNDDTPILTGTAEAGSTVSVTIGGATYTVVAVNGTWRVDLGLDTPTSGTLSLEAGENVVEVIATDAAGNASLAGTQTLVIDTGDSATPIFTSPALTNAPLPILEGTADAGDTVTVTVGGATYTVVATNGEWTLNLATAAPASGTLALNVNGPNVVTAVAADTAGNVSSTTTQTLVIDTTPPVAPTITSPALTNDDEPMLTGTAEAGSSVTVSIGGATYTFIADSATWSLSLVTTPPSTGTLALNVNGPNNVTVTATDLAGNVSQAGTQQLTIDTTAPNAPVVTSPHLTDDTTPVISGTAEAGTTVVVTVGGATYTLTAPTGTWSVDLGSATPSSGTLALNVNGTNPISVTARDAAGNLSVAGTQDLVIDPSAPTPLAITSGALTNEDEPIITGTAAPGIVTVVVGSATYEVTAAGGVWSLNLATATPVSGTLALNVNGTNLITATQGENTANQTLTLDTTPPNLPVITSASRSDVAAPIISGTAEVGSTVTVEVGGAIYVLPTVNGAWSVDLASVNPTSGTLALDENGTNPVRVTATDAAGNTSGARTQDLVIDTAAPEPVTITSAALTDLAEPIITGTADPDSTLSVTVGGATYTVVPLANGTWTLNLASATPASGTLALNPNGPNSITATDGTTTATQTLVIDTTAPVEPFIGSPAFTNDETPTLSGSAESGSTVTVSVGGATYTVTAVNGTWSVDLGTATPTSGQLSLIVNGENPVSVIASDAAGNASPAVTQTLVIDTVPPLPPAITSPATTSVQAPVLSGSAEAGSTVVVTVGGATYTVTAPNGAWSVNLAEATPTEGTLSLDQDGPNPVSVTATDPAGNTSDAGTQQLVIDPTAPTPLAITSPALTNDDAPVISGTAPEGSTVSVTIGGATFTVTTAANGTWTLNLATTEPTSGALVLNPNGNNAISATDGTTTANQTLVIDTTDPAAPVFGNPTLTNAAAPVVSGTAENGTTVTVTVNDGATYIVVATNGTWQVDLASATPVSGTLSLNGNGDNTITARATDPAGNLSGVTTQTLVIDTVAPATPVVTSQAITNVAAPQLIGTADAGTEVLVTVGGATYAVTPTAQNQWTLNLATATPVTGTLVLNTNGNNPVSVVSTDAAGNVSETGSQTLVIDTVPPLAPTLTFTAVGATWRVSVNGLEADATWEWQLNDGGWVTGTGNSFTIPLQALTAGSVTVRQTDAAQNQGPIGTNTQAQNPPTTPPIDPPGEDDQDEDGDGLPDRIEDGVPGLNGSAQGDGNGDGIPDALQNDVTSLPWQIGADGQVRWVTLANDAGLTQLDVRTSLLDDEDLPAGLSLPLGALSFRLANVPEGGSVSFSLFIDKQEPINGFWKQINGNWINIASAVVDAGDKYRIDFTIEDGGWFDADGERNGVIIDPGAPGWFDGDPYDMDDDQAPDWLELGVGLTPGVKDNDVFARDDLFVMQLYRDTLGREAEAEGLAYWVDQLETGTLDRPDLVFAVLDNPEAVALVDLTRLSVGLLDRVPDDAELAAWRNAVAQGDTDALADAFVINATGGDVSDADFIDRLYEMALARDVDPQGRDYWLGQLTDGKSRGELALDVLNTAEADERHGDDIDIAVLYVALLGREVDPVGLAYWQESIDAGYSANDVIIGITGSTEYHDRFLPAEAA